MTASDAHPLVLVGMHRSGTSFVSSLMRASGIDMGARLMPPARDNVRGFYENLDFVEFHERWLRLCGHEPAGWLAPRALTLPPEAFIEASDVIGRNRSKHAWGWKDPRTSLFLDFWAKLLPNAGYVIIYREPADVIESLLARGDAAISVSPELAARAWLSHNAAALRFARAHRTNCMIANVRVVARDPKRFLEMISARFGVNLNADIPSPFERHLMRGLEPSGLKPSLLRYLLPEIERVFLDLEQEADLAATVHREGAITPKRAKDAFFSAWRASCAAVTDPAPRTSIGAPSRLHLPPDGYSAYAGQTKDVLTEYQDALSNFAKRLQGERT